jgi:integrase
MLKIKDIDLDKQLIFVRAEIAKNDRDSVRTIPDVAIDTFRQLDLAGRSGDDYIFSWDKLFEFVPGRMKMDSRNIAKYWEKVIRKQLGWNLDKQFYSLKDTGITNMLTDNIAPNVVQSQADHTSLSITSIYIQKNKGIQQQIKTGAKSFDKN